MCPYYQLEHLLDICPRECTPFLMGLFEFFGVQLHELFVYIGYQYPIRFKIGKNLFPICQLPFFVLLTVSFALQKLCNFMSSHLSILDLRAQAIALLFRKISPVPMPSRGFSHIFLYKFQCLLFYVKFLDPLRFDLSTRRFSCM